MTVKEVSYSNDYFEDLKKDYPDEINKLEEALIKYLGDNELKILKSEFPDNWWNYLTKNLSHLFEIFTSIDEYQNPFNDLK